MYFVSLQPNKKLFYLGNYYNFYIKIYNVSILRRIFLFYLWFSAVLVRLNVLGE